MKRNAQSSLPTRGYAPPEAWPEPGVPLVAGDETRSPQEVCRCAAVVFCSIILAVIIVIAAICAAW